MELYCKDCGAPIKYSGRGPHPKYCESCRKIHYWERQIRYRQSERGKEKRREYVRRYNQTENGKASRKKRRDKAWAKRRALKAGVEHEPWTREEIIKRDNGICQICGLPIYDYDDSPNRLKPEIDHIVPISVGGADKADNLRLTHAFCNQHKGCREADIKYCKSIISSELEALAEKLL